MKLLKLLSAFLLLCAQSAQAADPLRYAVVSLVGDQITVSIRQFTTGTRLNRTEDIASPVLGQRLDDEVLEEVDKLLPTLVPGAQVSLLGLSSAEAYRVPTDTLLQMPALQKALQAEHPDRIVLVHKLRQETRLFVEGGYVGSGHLQGLGFYLDNSMKLVRGEAGRTNRGFIAPYAYIGLSLIDGRDLREIRTVPVAASEVIAASAGSTGLAWDALNDEHKVTTLRAMLREAVRANLPKLLASETRRD